MSVIARLRIRHHGCKSERIPAGARATYLGADAAGCLGVARANTPGGMTEFLALYDKEVVPSDVLYLSDSCAVFRSTCIQQHPDGVIGRIGRAGGTVMWPVVHEDGIERVTVLAPSNAALSRIVAELREIGDLAVDAIRSADPERLDAKVSPVDAQSEFGERQLAVLKAALEFGYYEEPRQISAEKLAETLGMRRSTVLEHLRKAEAVIMRHVAENMALGIRQVKRVGRPRA